MSRLDNLIAELCPDGVEYKQIKEVASIERGKRVVREQLPIEGKYVVFQNSLTPLGFFDEFNFCGHTTFVIGAGAAGEIGYSEKDFWAADDCYPLVCKPLMDGKFLYHFLLSKKEYIHSQVRKGSIPRLPRMVIENMKMPVPPLEVQREIVRILDNFTELTAELTARKKQYEYYRRELLTFNTDIPKKKLGTTCVMKAGKAIPSEMISIVKTTDSPITCYGGNGIRGYVKEANNHGEFPLIGRQGALCGNVNYATGDFYATEHAVVVTSQGEYTQRFLYHLLTHMNLNQYKSAGAQPGLSVRNLEEIFAPVPSLAVQERIVNVLDNFEAICKDLNIGLPAEIEARQKQYEYYRDLLLTFVETGRTIGTEEQRNHN